MANPQYVTFDQVAAKYSPRQVKAAFTDDGSNTMNQTAFDEAVEEASGIADAILGKAYPDPTARAAMMADPAVNGAIRTMVMAIGAGRKPSWRNAEGKGPYDGQMKEARQQLELVAAAALRPAAEATAGKNPVVRGSVVNHQSPTRLFTPTADKPNPGGY